MSAVKLFIVLSVINCFGLGSCVTFNFLQTDGFDAKANCTACEQIYQTALAHVKPESIANSTSARAFMIGECNFFRQQQIPFWTFCFEMYTQHFDEFWQDLKNNVDSVQACTTLGICV